MRREVKATIQNCQRLRIRKSPNLNSDVVGYINKGEVFNAVTIDGKDDWHRVKDKAFPYGFVFAKFVKII